MSHDDLHVCPNCGPESPLLPAVIDDRIVCPICGELGPLAIGEAVRVPDVIGEILAWRAWQVRMVGRRPFLHSVTHGEHFWRPDAWTVATCAYGHRPETIPVETHTCGLYAARTREHLMELHYPTACMDAEGLVVIGEVGLCGKVIPGSQGWRAQKGRVVRLHVPYAHKRVAESLRDVYRCQVVLGNALGVKDEINIQDLRALRAARTKRKEQ